MRKLFSSKKATRYRHKTENRAKRSTGVSATGKSTRPSSRKKIIYVSVVVVGVVLTTAALTVLLRDVGEDAAARSEYGQIRDRFPDIAGQPADDTSTNDNNDNTGNNGSSNSSNSGDNNNSDISGSNGDNEDFDEDADLEANEEEARALRELSLDELAAINGDFIGWINATNRIDYPVVQGRDNDRYISTTFFGNRNSAGAIFMDYRHLRGFDEHVVILYGHRTRDGSMFSALERYLDPDFLNRNRNIHITTRDGSILTYTIFAVAVTDAWDEAYTAGVYDTERASEVFPNVPYYASRFLLLSTCTRGSDDNERLIVYAALT